MSNVTVKVKTLRVSECTFVIPAGINNVLNLVRQISEMITLYEKGFRPDEDDCKKLLEPFEDGMYLTFRKSETLPDTGSTELALVPKVQTMTDVKLDQLLATIQFSTRTYNALTNFGCATIRDLAKMTKKELSNVPNLGRCSIAEIEELLKEQDLSLGMKV